MSFPFPRPLGFHGNRPLAWVAFLLLALAPAAQAEWRDIPCADMAKMPLGLARVDPRKIFTAEFQARPACPGSRSGSRAASS